MANEMTASVLAFEKKLVPSDGYLFGTLWERRKDDAQPLALNEKSVRGTISNRLNKALMADPAKLDAEIEKPNLQVVDDCSLRLDQDTLKIQFTLKVLGNVGIPSSCNNLEVFRRLREISKEYRDLTGFEELGYRYAMNIANGRFFWRNRVGAEMLEVCVHDPVSNNSWSFNALDYPLRDFEDMDETVKSLGSSIAAALAGESTNLLLTIEGFAQVGFGQETYPSEELVLGKQKADKSKILYQVDGHAAMHSQKIGNALRCIDTWYPGFNEGFIGPLAVEPYGAVTNLGKAFRTPRDKSDFYTIFDRCLLGKEISTSEQDYMMAVLIRGGVFGEKES